MMELGSAFVQLQADFLKIKDEDQALQKQRLRWMACMEEWTTRQAQFLESSGIDVVSPAAMSRPQHGTRLSAPESYKQKLPSHAPEMMSQWDVGTARSRGIAAADRIIDRHGTPRVAAVFQEEVVHAAPPAAVQAVPHQHADLPAELRHSFNTGQTQAHAGYNANDAMKQLHEKRQKNHSTARQTLGALGMDVDDEDPSEEGPEEPAKSCIGSVLQHLNKRHMHHIVHHPLFDVVTCLFILVSTIINGWEVELLARDPKTADDIPFQDIQLIFSSLFFLELVMRLMAYRWMFFFNKDWHWNLFDLTLVLLSVIELVFLIANPEKDDGFLSSASQRMLRTARLIRNLRIIRMMRFFYELRMMLAAVFGSLKTLLWLGILLGMLLYFFALCFVSGVTEHLEGDGSNLPDPVRELLNKEYGSLFSASLSLFKAVTGGESWGYLLDPFTDIHYGLVLLYLAYIVFTVFAFMNAVTSVFVDNAMQAAQDEREHLVKQKIREKEDMLAKLEALFLETDHDHSGEISKEEFHKQLESEETMAYFKVIGIEAHDATTLFDLIDDNYSDSIEIHEFVRVCPKLMGPATSFDVAHAKHETLKLARWLGRFMEYCARQFEQVTQVTCGGAPSIDEPPPKMGSVASNGSAFGYMETSTTTAEAIEGSPLRMRAGVESLPDSKLKRKFEYPSSTNSSRPVSPPSIGEFDPKKMFPSQPCCALEAPHSPAMRLRPAD